MDDSYRHNGGGGTLFCGDYGYYFYNFYWGLFDWLSVNGHRTLGSDMRAYEPLMLIIEYIMHICLFRPTVMFKIYLSISFAFCYISTCTKSKPVELNLFLLGMDR